MERKSRWQMFVSEFTFFKICHTARGSQVRPPCVTFESMSHDSMSHTTKYYSINYFRNWTFPRCTGRYNAVNRGDPISDEKDDSWDTGIVLESELKICSKSVPSLIRKSKLWFQISELKIFQRPAETGRHWLKVPDTVEKRPMKFGKCSILMFYLEFRSWKLNFKLSVFLIEQKPGGRFGNGGNWEDPGILGRWILVVYRTTNQIGLFIVQLQSM